MSEDVLIAADLLADAATNLLRSKTMRDELRYAKDLREALELYRAARTVPVAR